MKNLFLAALLILLSVFPALAATKVVEAVITTGVSDQVPIDSVQTYPAGVKRLYCYTRLTGAQEGSFITHVWYRGKGEMGRMRLPVKGSEWRTWSTKAFLPSWRGKWRVEVLDAQGKLLSTVSFTLN